MSFAFVAAGSVVVVGVFVNQRDHDLPCFIDEPKFIVQNLSTEWATIRIPLANLVGKPPYTEDRFSKLYIVCELVFEAEFGAETVYFKNVHYE